MPPLIGPHIWVLPGTSGTPSLNKPSFAMSPKNSLVVQILTQPLGAVVVLHEATLTSSSRVRASSCATTTPRVFGGPGFGFLNNLCKECACVSAGQSESGAKCEKSTRNLSLALFSGCVGIY